MSLPPVRPPRLDPRALGRQIRLAAVPRASEVIVESLESENQVIRLQAAGMLLDRVEGKPRQSVSIEIDPEEEDRKRFGDEVKALLAFVEDCQPELVGPALAWLRALTAGKVSEVPAGLIAPPSGHAAHGLFEHCLSLSTTVPALVAGVEPAP
jgi:hypothetical protein